MMNQLRIRNPGVRGVMWDCRSESPMPSRTNVTTTLVLDCRHFRVKKQPNLLCGVAGRPVVFHDSPGAKII